MINLSVLFIWSLFSLIDSALCYVVDALIIIVLPTSSQSVIFVGPPYCSHRVDKRSALKHKQRIRSTIIDVKLSVLNLSNILNFPLLPVSWQLKQIGNVYDQNGRQIARLLVTLPYQPRPLDPPSEVN